MIERRKLLAGGAGLAALTLAPAAVRAQTVSEQLDVILAKLLQRQFDKTLDHNPEQATRLGLDKGPLSKLRFKLDDRSPAAADRRRQEITDQLDELGAVPRDHLSRQGAVSYDVAGFRLENESALARRFHYGVTGRAQPYVVSQQGGAYYGIPNLLTNAHPVQTREDAEAYLTRLKGFALALDQDTECVRRDAVLGVVPPDFILAQTLVNLRRLRDQPAASSVLVRSLADRARAKGLGDYEPQAAAAFTSAVAPALDRQIAALEALKPSATHEAGVWRLPDGDAYYQAAITQSLTVKLSPEDVHHTGLTQVAALEGEIDRLLKDYGLNDGSVGARLAGLNRDPKNLYPDTDEAKAQLVNELNGLVAGMTARLPKAFSHLPGAALDIRRVPAYIEAGAPLGYYEAAPLDNSRPAIYYINLKSAADWPRFQLPTLTYHEGIPGHHLQISRAREIADLPIYRRTAQFGAYTEGWALYAEQLADELGAYEKDPLGRIGYAQSLLFRAVRLVVDSGLHSKRWSREQAIKYMVDTTGRAQSAAASEIDRYCAWPGQACSYKMGHTVLVNERQNAIQKLGRKFDLKAFHEVVLKEGAVPLSTLQRLIDDWAERKLTYG